VLAAVAVGLILYGSLYPFRFSLQADLVGALGRGWGQPAGGRGDLLANLALYAPLGFFAAASLVGALPRAVVVPFVVLAGAMLSGVVEFAQFHVPGRTSSLWDIYLNTAGCALGALAAATGGAGLLSAALDPRGRRAEPFAVLLILCWLGYRLYPYVPTIDLQKYLDSLKPLLLAPVFEPFRSFRLAVLWLVAAHLLETAGGRFRPALLVPAVLAGTLLSGVVIVDRVVSLADVLAVLAALLGWAVLRRSRWFGPVLLALLGVVVVADRLAPFDFAATGRPFGWVPFRSVFAGHWGRGLQSMLEKCFLYGALLWLLVREGASLRLAAGAGMLLVFAASLLQTRLPGRSAEITDTVLVGGLAIVLTLLTARGEDGRIKAHRSRVRPSIP
jgi:VanZ family protein